jgi:hypothetical protein
VRRHGGVESAYVGLLLRAACGKQVGFVRQADTRKRAADTFWRIRKRVWRLRPPGGSAGFRNKVTGPSLEFFGEIHLYSAAGTGEVKHAVDSTVAMFPQQEPLAHKLYALGFIGTQWNIRCCSAFGVYRDCLSAIDFQQIEFRRNAKGFGSKRHGAGYGWRHVAALFRFRQRVVVLVEPAVHGTSVVRKVIVLPAAVHEHQVKKPWTIGIFIHHPDRKRIPGVSIFYRRIHDRYAHYLPACGKAVNMPKP